MSTVSTHPLWGEYAAYIGHLLADVRCTESAGTVMAVQHAFTQWRTMTLELRAGDGEMFFIGNGASASMASHCAADIFKNASIRTRVFTDPAHITAYGNDLCYAQVFATPLRQLARAGDMLVAISSSGNSPNIVEACRAVRERNGIVVTLSAFGENNALRQLGNLNFYIPANTYGLAESTHAALLHYWMDSVNLYPVATHASVS